MKELVPNEQKLCNKILFNKKDHKYLVNGDHYNSVTQTDTTFDWFFKNTINPIRLKNAQLRGNQIHSAIEQIIKKKFDIDCFFENNECSKPTQKKIKTLEETLPDLLKEFDVLATELPLADTEIRLVGTVDIILRRKRDGQIIIADWKTCSIEEAKKPTRHIKFLPQMMKYAYLVSRNFLDINIEDIGLMTIFVNDDDVRGVVFNLGAAVDETPTSIRSR